MKKLFILLMMTAASYTFASDEAGFYYNNESLSERKVAEEFFKEMKIREEEDQEVDVCYEGDWEEATENVNAIISINVLDIYGAGELDVEIYHKNGDSTYGIISTCY